MSSSSRVSKNPPSASPFGEWVRSVRGYYGISQKDLAEHLGFKSNTGVSFVESSGRLPKTVEDARRWIEAILSCEATLLLPEATKAKLREEGEKAWTLSRVNHVGTSVLQSIPGVAGILPESATQTHVLDSAGRRWRVKLGKSTTLTPETAQMLAAIGLVEAVE